MSISNVVLQVQYASIFLASRRFFEAGAGSISSLAERVLRAHADGNVSDEWLEHVRTHTLVVKS